MSAVPVVDDRVPEVKGGYVLLPCDPPKGLMVWPNPSDPNELQYRLRYGPPLTASEQLQAASHLEAYSYLVGLDQRTRNKRCSEIKAALEAQR